MRGARGIRAVLGAVIVLAASPLPAAAASGSNRSARTADDQAAVGALNVLLQEGWTGLTGDMQANASRWLKQTLEGRIAHGSGKVSGLKWSFDLEVAKVEPIINLHNTPGFRSIGLTGFTLGFPAQGSWELGVRGTVKGHAKVKAGGTTLFSWSPSFKFGLVLPKLAVPITVGIDSSNPELPRMTGFGFQPGARLVGEGFLAALGIDLHGSGGPVAGGQVVSGDANDLRLGIPGLSASLNANLGIEFDPSAQFGGLEAAGDVETARGSAQLKLHTAFEQVRFRLHGALHVEIPRIKKQSVPFNVNFALPVPSSDAINQFLLAVQGLGGGLPRHWGDAATLQHPAPSPPASADGELAKAADDLEGDIVSHLPFGAVLSIDTVPAKRPVARRPRGRQAAVVATTKWGLENDSAIFTGHYLAAEALRYAATKSPEALSRVKFVLGGIERLFWVTQDAVLIKGQVQTRYSGHTRRGQGNFFARAAAPDAEADRFSEGSLRAPGHDCAYVRPEGGWQVSLGSKTTTVATFDEAKALAGSRSGIKGISAKAAIAPSRRPKTRPTTISPVGKVWYGFGCGDKHPTSRDAVVGISLGLAFAHELVGDPEVTSRTATLGSDMVAYLVDHSWQITVPPSDTHGQNYWGSWDAQLSLLRLGATFDPARFLSTYNLASAAVPLIWLPGWLSTLDPLAQYYKFNLGEGTLATALLLEHNTALRLGYDYAYRVLAAPVRRHKNAYFDALEIFNRPADQRAEAASERAGSNPQISLADEIRSLLLSWERRRQLIRGSNGLPRNDIAHLDRLLALWPGNVGLYTTFDLKAQCLAGYALDPEDRIGNGMDFMWQRSPFATGAEPSHCNGARRPSEAEIRHNGAEATREAAGVDFLLPYWMTVYTHTISRP